MIPATTPPTCYLVRCNKVWQVIKLASRRTQPAPTQSWVNVYTSSGGLYDSPTSARVGAAIGVGYAGCVNIETGEWVHHREALT